MSVVNTPITAGSHVVDPGSRIRSTVSRHACGYYPRMRQADAVLDKIYIGRDRLTGEEISRLAVTADAPVDIVNLLFGLPAGDYSRAEVDAVLDRIGGLVTSGHGVPASDLPEVDLLRELAEMHRTRNDTLRHGSDHALARHDQRMAELEGEYLRRFPDREVDPRRLRAGAPQ